MICYNALMLGSTFSRPQLFCTEIYSQSQLKLQYHYKCCYLSYFDQKFGVKMLL